MMATEWITVFIPNCLPRSRVALMALYGVTSVPMVPLPFVV